MSLFAVNLARRFGPGILLSFGLAAAAQSTPPPATQPIEQPKIKLVAPTDSDPALNANDPDAPSSDSPDGFNAPSSLFGHGPTASFDVLPRGPAPVQLNSAQWQQFLNAKKNWTLMTPAQILGVPTPEQILGVTDPNSKLTPEQQFLNRQDINAQASATNTASGFGTTIWQSSDPSARVFGRTAGLGNFGNTISGSISGSDSTIPGNNRTFTSPFINQNQSGLWSSSSQVSDSTWASPFASPLPQAKQTQDQRDGMERFRALLNSETPSPAPAANASSYGQPAAFHSFSQPSTAFSALGTLPRPLDNGISRPTGLTPLPGITGPPPAPPKKEPLVQPPPWLQSGPGMATLPQRQF